MIAWIVLIQALLALAGLSAICLLTRRSRDNRPFEGPGR